MITNAQIGDDGDEDDDTKTDSDWESADDGTHGGNKGGGGDKSATVISKVSKAVSRSRSARPGGKPSND